MHAHEAAGPAGEWPGWLARLALTDFCSIEVVLAVARSAGADVSRGVARAIFADLERAGLLRETGVRGVYLLRPEVAAGWLTELERNEPGVAEVRRQLSAAGLMEPAGGIGPELAAMALGTGDWAGSEAIWRLYSPGDLLGDARVRAGYAAVPTELRADYPGLSFAAAVAAAYEPDTGRLDLDRMATALIRDGYTIHGAWNQHLSAEARVVAGTMWMLGHVAIPGSTTDGDDLVWGAYDHIVQLIRDSSLRRAALTPRALTFFHSTVALIALIRGDWSRARREGEYAIILNEGCGLPGFLAAFVVESCCAIAGDTQGSAAAGILLAEHALHGCAPHAWVEPAFHLIRAASALRCLDGEQAGHHLRKHSLEASTAQWLSTRPLHAALLSTTAIIWEDPQQALAQFDSLVPELGGGIGYGAPWERLLLRCRAELLLAQGAGTQAERIVNDLAGIADDTVSAVPAAWLHLCAGRFTEALTKADEGLFELKLSHADRAFLYAAKSAALQQGGATEELVASAATAACVICEQADTLVPFAVLPSAVRRYLVAEHPRHHNVGSCFINRAAQRGVFDRLRDGTLEVLTPLRLTRREEELLPLLATAASVPEIASQQYVSANTLRKQVVTLRQKFGATSRDDLIRRAHEAGLLNRTAKPGPGSAGG
ncbi:MAG TPA: LuxR C-terminal-related transcriptional regulator [Propionicimonas sp.]|uniref:helix-turn-helix transcriptional regulator n=1 Tax=Propionicimonas sp. TaxID=1955623 RepID=UPI002F428BF1